MAKLKHLKSLTIKSSNHKTSPRALGVSTLHARLKRLCINIKSFSFLLLIKNQTGPSPLLQPGSRLHLKRRRVGGQTGFELSHRWAGRALRIRAGGTGVCGVCVVVDLGVGAGASAGSGGNGGDGGGCGGGGRGG